MRAIERMTGAHDRRVRDRRLWPVRMIDSCITDACVTVEERPFRAA